MSDPRTIRAARDAHMLVAITTHTFICTMANLGMGYELNDSSEQVWECTPMALLIHVRDQALLAVLGTSGRVVAVVEALHGVRMETDEDFADSGQAARHAVLASMRAQFDAEDAQGKGYLLGTEFARFEAIYGGDVPVPAVPEAYEAQADAFTREFQRARSEYDPSAARCTC